MVHKLPTWSEIRDKIERREKLTYLESFIYRHEPILDAREQRDFRRRLKAVVKELAEMEPA